MTARAMVAERTEMEPLASRWSRFIAGMDAAYEQLALAQGMPYIRHAPDELEEIAALVAECGRAPEAAIVLPTWEDVSERPAAPQV